MAVLTRHTWPGNVRELENVVYRSAVIAQGDAILVKDLPPEIRGETTGDTAHPFSLNLKVALDYLLEQQRPADQPLMAQIEREIAQHALTAANGDEAAAAKRLGITKVGLRKRLKPAPAESA
jgi:two-component system nitrogen regulation response regulator GlnG